MTMHPSADDPGSKPRASDEPADAGMNKDTRCNTVALDLDAVRTIAKASRTTPGAPDSEPKTESPGKPARKEAPLKPAPRERPSAPAKVIVQPPLAREEASKPQRSPTGKEASAPVSPPAPPVAVKTTKDASPPASAGGRAVLVVACACLALLLVLTWRLVVAPVEPSGPAAAQAAHGASRAPAEATGEPPPTSAPMASVTTTASTESASDLPPLEESTKPTVPVGSSSMTGAAPSFLAPSVPRPSGSTTAITIPYQ